MKWATIITEIISLIGGGVGGALGLVNNLLKSGFRSAMQYHQEGIAFAREMGMNAKEAQAYTEVLTDRTEKLAAKYGVAAEQVKELQRNISIATSRQLMLNETQAEQFLQLNKLVGSSTVSKFTEEMMNGMGGQVDAVTGAVSKAYATAAKSGLNAQKVSEKIASNLGMANRLSFRNGVEGLTRMAMQAEKMGMNLSSVETAAGKFLDLQDAIQNTAKLQMLGGSASAMFSNPLTAAYEANYDPEAFAKRMQDSLASYATFDANKGLSSVNGMNMDFVRNIAQAMGISTEEATRMAKKNAEVKYKESHISGAYSNLTQEQRDFLINKSNVANGRVQFTTSEGKKVDLSSGQNIDPKVLEEMMKYNGMSDRDIMEENARSLSSINELLKGISDSIGALFAKFLNGLFPKFQGDIQNIGAHVKEKLLPVAEHVGAAARNIYEWVKGHQNKIEAVFDGLIGFMKFATEHWKLTLGAILGFKALKTIGGIGLGGGNTVGSKAASAAGRGISNFGKWLFTTSRDTNIATRLGYADARANGSGRIMSAIKAPFKGASLLSSGQKLTNVGGAALGVGLGAYNAITADNAEDRGAGIGTAVGTALGTVVGGPIGAAIGGFLGDFAGRFIGEHWGEITDTISNAWNTVVEGGKMVWDGIVNGAKSVWDIAKKGFGYVLDFGKWLIDNNPLALMVKGVGAIFGQDWSPTKLISKFLGGSDEGHANGGIVSSKDDVIGVAKGEIVLDKTMQENLVSILKNPQVTAKPVGEKEYIYTPNRTETSNVNGNTITVKDFNINLSGTIKLDGGNSSKNIDVNALLNDYQFMSSLKEMIKTSINNDMNGGRYMNDLATRRGQVSSSSIIAK